MSLDPRLRGRASRRSGPYPLGQLTDKVLFAIARQVVHRLAVGHGDITGDDFDAIFANAIGGMGNIIFAMLHGGWDEAAICNEIGLEPDELIRLKYVTGFAKLFEGVEYRKSWETRRQLQIRRDYEMTIK